MTTLTTDPAATAISRRRFLKGSAALGAGLVLAFNLPSTLRLMRDANAAGHVTAIEHRRADDATFGLRLTVHATNRGPRDAIRYSEKLVDGVIAAFHNDRRSDALVATLTPKLRGVTAGALGQVLEQPAGPLFSLPAIRTKGGYVQISPDDERCIVGEVTITRDSLGPWPELSGELFTVRPFDPPAPR